MTINEFAETLRKLSDNPALVERALADAVAELENKELFSTFAECPAKADMIQNF